MFAIAFDLTVAETEQHHPKGMQQVYADIGAALARFDFRRIQGSVYVCDDEDLGNLFDAMNALKALPWFPPSVRASAPSASSSGRTSRHGSKTFPRKS